MIFSIDTIKKEITLSESIDLQEFILLIPKIFMKDSIFGDMTGYTLKVNSVTYQPYVYPSTSGNGWTTTTNVYGNGTSTATSLTTNLV